jgi:hypothetical protein
MKAEEYQERREEASGWPIHIVSYRLGDRFHCTVDNVDPGARLSRGEGATREEAESIALEKAGRHLAKTKRMPAQG